MAWDDLGDLENRLQLALWRFDWESADETCRNIIDRLPGETTHFGLLRCSERHLPQEGQTVVSTGPLENLKSRKRHRGLEPRALRSTSRKTVRQGVQAKQLGRATQRLVSSPD